METIEDKNIVHKGVRGLLKNSLQLPDGVWKRCLKQNSKTFYVRADWRKLENAVVTNGPVLDRKRKLSFRFSMTSMLDLILERYEPFISSWLDSYLISGGGSVSQGSRDVDSELNTHVNQFVRYINDNTYGQASASILRNATAFRGSATAIDGKLVNSLLATYGCEALSFVPVRFHEVESSSRHMNGLAGTYLFCRFLPQAKFDYSPYTQMQGAFSQAAGYGNFANVDRSCTSSVRTSNIVVFRVRDELLSKHPGNTNTHAYRDSTDSSELFLLKDVHYLKGTLPTDYDANYNNQMWLPLLDDRENNIPFYDSYMAEPLTRHTHCLWSVGFTADSAGVGNKVKFIGEYSDSRVTHDMVKDSLDDYELTSDSAFRGIGKIYVDMDGICYCPLTGAALECVVDFCPRVDHPSNGTHTYVL